MLYNKTAYLALIRFYVISESQSTENPKESQGGALGPDWSVNLHMTGAIQVIYI